MITYKLLTAQSNKNIKIEILVLKFDIYRMTKFDQLYMPIRIAIFASGSGSNAENIFNYFQAMDDVSISVILTNNPTAGVIKRAEKMDVPSLVFNREEFYSTDKIESHLSNEKIDFIVLAGFLWLVPLNLIRLYRNRIVNIHPALLPAFGGKGYYGDKVHEAVISSRQIISGITIHHVNEKFDEGAIIFQAACQVEKSDDAKSLAKKIHNLEYKYFPVVIEKSIRIYQEKNIEA